MLTQSKTEELVQQSKFIFVGTVVQLQATTVAQADPRICAIVKVDKVVDSPDVMKGIENTNITVQLPAQSNITAGEKAIFFTQGWIFEKSIAVIAHGFDKDSAKLEDMIKQVLNSKTSLADK